MKKLLALLKRHRFWLALIAVFLLLDAALGMVIRPFLIRSGRFVLNDYEVVRRDHPEEVWDKVFFGNSIVISAYREEESESGYVNLGIDYGVVTDLWDMVRKGTIEIGSELVIGLNDLTLYDKFETNPGYPWHRAWYEPYCYFERDRLRQLFTETVQLALTGSGPSWDHLGQERSYYYGSLSQAELDERGAASKYNDLPIEDFDENFRALGSLDAWCQKHGVRMRVVWMPVNPTFESTDSTLRVYERAKTFCEDAGVEFHDMSDALAPSCFYDVGHLNHEYGAYVFTREIEAWLLS